MKNLIFLIFLISGCAVKPTVSSEILNPSVHVQSIKSISFSNRLFYENKIALTHRQIETLKEIESRKITKSVILVKIDFWALQQPEIVLNIGKNKYKLEVDETPVSWTCPGKDVCAVFVVCDKEMIYGMVFIEGVLYKIAYLGENLYAIVEQKN